VQRSRVTVQYNYLPDQVFEHEVDGLYCVVREVAGSPPNVPLTQVLEALDIALRRWEAAGGDVGEFPPNAVEHADAFRLVKPDTILFDLWPLRLFCSECGHVSVLEWTGDDSTRLRSRRCRHCRRGKYQQMPYYRVHTCGARGQMSLPDCPTHRAAALFFHDTGSFYTAYYRCAVPGCGEQIQIPFYTCRCNFIPPGLDETDRAAVRRSKTFDPVTARDSKAYYGQRLTLINVAGARLSVALASPRGPLYALGHYMGTITDLSGLTAELSGRPAATDEAYAESMRVLDQVRPHLDEASFSVMWQNHLRSFGPQAALHETRDALTTEVVEASRSDRRVMERAFLYTDHDVEDLHKVAKRWRAGGHTTLASRVDVGIRRAKGYGLSRISVVRDFPVALVGYGYTRAVSDHRARLRPFPARHDDDRLPLITIDSNTEGILVELDPQVLFAWCETNGWIAEPAPTNEVAARAWVLRTMFGAETPASAAVRRITHVWSHLLIHALARYSSFSATSGAEYLLERQASTLIYVARYTTFNLGGLIALAEQHLATWITEAVESARTCVHDPVCLAERGGCHKCLALAFGCERFNRGLDRGYLVGGGTLDVAEGFLYTAERLASP
jgi:hypothetical protein